MVCGGRSRIEHEGLQTPELNGNHNVRPHLYMTFTNGLNS